MATWASVDPRNGAVVAYDVMTNMLLEESFSKGENQLSILLGGNPFVVKFREMRQYNAAGLWRTVQRSVPDAASAPLDLNFDDGTMSLCLEATDRADALTMKVRELIVDRKYRWKCLGTHDVLCAIQVYEWILGVFSDDRYRLRYGGSSADQQLCNLPLSSEVPAYFANVSDGSIYRRKVLSLLGLRNLLMHGGDIFNDLLSKLFSGNTADYASKTGLSKMKHYTGNTVDLDSVVLNPSRQLADINRMLPAGRKPFASAEMFERDPLCHEMVIHQAECLIQDFVQKMKLSPQELRSRHLLLDPKAPIHVAQHNTDRGLMPVWQYRNVGVSTYHANVPNLDDVIGALLLAPLHLVKGFALAMRSESKPRGEAINEFFEDCVSDSCFNGKWKAIEAFVGTWSTCDTVSAVLSRLQQEHQDKFQPLLALDDRKAEEQLMVRLVREKRLQGQDEKTKVKRLITEADVAQWIELTN